MTPDVVISTLPLSEGDILYHTTLISEVFKLCHKQRLVKNLQSSHQYLCTGTHEHDFNEVKLHLECVLSLNTYNVFKKG